MHPIAAQLLEQHVAFEIDALSGKGLQPFLRAEVRRLFALAETTPLSDFATERRCVGAFRRLLVKARIPASAEAFIVSLVLCAGEVIEESDVTLGEIIGRDRFLEVVELTANLQDYRSRLIADLCNHPLYSELLSSLVYQALARYLVDDNLISQRVPGVGSMLKLGREVANRAVPGLDERLEKRLRSYIRGYLPSLISASEQFIDRAISDEAFLQRLSGAWRDISAQEVAGLFEGLNPADVERFGDWGGRYWDELRRSEVFALTGEALIAHVYESYGDEPLALLLGDLGISRSLVSSELVAFAPPLAKRLRDCGYLEELLRSRLAPFYASGPVMELLRQGH